MFMRRFRIAVIATLLGFDVFAHAYGGEAAARVYRCTVDGRLTFSDRPCPNASDATEIEVSAVNSYSAPEPARTRSAPEKRAPPQNRNNESIAAEQSRAKQQCARLRLQLDSLEEKLRSGYTAKEDRKLHERQRQLQERMRIERCR
jgi:hypothetical protein